jgi:hypothetical protein
LVWQRLRHVLFYGVMRSIRQWDLWLGLPHLWQYGG